MLSDRFSRRINKSKLFYLPIPGDEINFGSPSPCPVETEHTIRIPRSTLGNDKHFGTESTCEYDDQEPYETYKLKIIKVCKDIGLREPLELDHLRGGSFNRVIGLTLASYPGRRFIIRAPRFSDDFDISAETKNQVAVHQYLSQHLPVPAILAYDSSHDNALASPFVVQERIKGLDIEQVYYGLPLEEKLQVTTAVAELMIKMQSLKMDSPGRLVANESLPSRSDSPLLSTRKADITGYRMEKYGECEYMVTRKSQQLTNLMIAMLEDHKVAEGDSDEEYKRLQQIAREMQIAGLIHNIDSYCSLWHWDFAARNVMIDRAGVKELRGGSDQLLQMQSSRVSKILGGMLIKYHNLRSRCLQTLKSKFHLLKLLLISGNAEQTLQPKEQSYGDKQSRSPWVVTGVLDWDGAKSVPHVLVRTPAQWLWCNENDRSSEWIENFDKAPSRDLTTEEVLIKAHFDQIMSKADSTYNEDAYHRGPWLRRLWSFALYGLFSDSSESKPYEDFVKGWGEYYAKISRPSLEVLKKANGDGEVPDSE